MILIDELLNEDKLTFEEKNIDVDGITYHGWEINKPIKYNPNQLSIEERKKMADLIMKGKAIAVQYFEDLTEEEQKEYVNKLVNIKFNGNKSTIIENDHFPIDTVVKVVSVEGTPLSEYYVGKIGTIVKVNDHGDDEHYRYSHVIDFDTMSINDTDDWIDNDGNDLNEFYINLFLPHIEEYPLYKTSIHEHI